MAAVTDGGTGPPEDGQQMGQEDQGTGAPEETEMARDHQEGLGVEEHSGAVQEPPIRLPALERRRQLDFVSTVAHISLIAQALGGVAQQKRGSIDGSRREQSTNRSRGEPTGRLRIVGSTGGARAEKRLSGLHPAQLCTGTKRGRARGGGNPPV